MMRLLFIYFMIFWGASTHAYNPGNATVERARFVFEAVATSEEAGIEFLALTDGKTNLSPIMKGYRGAVMMMMAQYGINPISKWNRFKEGRTLLDNAIAEESSNAELIYLRFCIQTNAPSFLGYNHETSADYAFLKQALPGIRDKAVYQRIKSYLNRNQIKNR